MIEILCKKDLQFLKMKYLQCTVSQQVISDSHHYLSPRVHYLIHFCPLSLNLGIIA